MGELGKAVVTNIVAVGALEAVSGVLSADAVREAVVSRMPARFRELNEQAYALGLNFGAEALTLLEAPSGSRTA